MSGPERRAQVIVDELCKLRRLTDEGLAAGVLTRQGANQKRRGQRIIGLDDLPWLCQVFEVDPTLFVVPPEDWDEYGLMGLRKHEWTYLRAVLSDVDQREAGFAAIELVAAATLSLISGFAALRVPSVAPVLQVIAENVREDDVMSGDEILAA